MVGTPPLTLPQQRWLGAPLLTLPGADVALTVPVQTELSYRETQPTVELGLV